MKVEENTFVFKTHKVTRGVVIFCNTGVVTHDRMQDWLQNVPKFIGCSKGIH
jgi:hypothetical protein